jgi:26S proteasome regulatory subunit (ATPase 3-interacting protein)
MPTKPKRRVILSDSEDSDVFENQKSSSEKSDEDSVSVVSEGSEDDLNDDNEEKEIKIPKKRDRRLSDVSESSNNKKVAKSKSPLSTKKKVAISPPIASKNKAISPKSISSSSKVVKEGITKHSKSSSSTSSTNKMSIESSTDVTRGPPVTSDSGAKKLLLQYMQQQNRPYSSIQVTDNLHGRIQKSVVERLLKSFADTPDSGIVEKVYGKAKIYYPDQSQIADVKVGELDRIDKEIEHSKLNFNQFVAKQKTISLELAKLQKEPTDENLDKVLADLETEVSEKQSRVDQISSATLEPEALENTIKVLNFLNYS